MEGGLGGFWLEYQHGAHGGIHQLLPEGGGGGGGGGGGTGVSSRFEEFEEPAVGEPWNCGFRECLDSLPAADERGLANAGSKLGFETGQSPPYRETDKALSFPLRPQNPKTQKIQNPKNPKTHAYAPTWLVRHVWSRMARLILLSTSATVSG